MRWNFVMFTIISIFSSDIRIMSFFLNIYAKQLIWDSIYHLQVFWIILYTQKHYLDLIIDCYTCRRIPELCWLRHDITWLLLMGVYIRRFLCISTGKIFTSLQGRLTQVWSDLSCLLHFRKNIYSRNP